MPYKMNKGATAMYGPKAMMMKKGATAMKKGATFYLIFQLNYYFQL